MLMNFGTLTMLRTDPAHIGNEPLSTLATSGYNREKKNNGAQKNKLSFEDYLLSAVDSVSDKQIASDAIAEQLITDPDSVDVHDVTIAMAEASLSLNLAQTVIDRLIKDWTEITTTR